MATPDNPTSGPTNFIGMNWSRANSMQNMTDHNMAVSRMIDTNAGVFSMNFLIMIFVLA